jgi:osmotically-inducible protein OsmY
VRKIGIGVAAGVAIAFFVRWRGGFSRAADVVTQHVPDAIKPGTDASRDATADDQPTQLLETEGPRDGDVAAGDPDDAVLRDRVMSEVLGDERFKGSVNVATEYGRVVLHGELATPDLIDELVTAVRSVEGVRDVDARLHVQQTQVDVQLPKRPSELEERL